MIKNIKYQIDRERYYINREDVIKKIQSIVRMFLKKNRYSCVNEIDILTMDNKMEIIDVDDAGQLMIKYARSVELSGIYNIYSKAVVTQEEFVNLTSTVFNMPIKSFSDIFNQKMEKEALEAFTSNIILKSEFNDILKGFDYTDLESSLNKIKSR